jgi:predicted O-methyltransferase YrrM
MKHIKIIKEEVKKINLDSISEYKLKDGSDFSEAGVEAYKFYAYLSTLVNDSIIVEVGSRFGRSGLALSYNESNKVISFDILEQGASEIKKNNLEFRIGNFMDSDIDWNSIDIIMIDVDPHDGIKEREFVDFLYNKNWKGILVLDDILPNWPVIIPGANPVAMNEWWMSIEEEKYDVSDIGHFSGTGIVNIGNKFKIEIC